MRNYKYLIFSLGLIFMTTACQITVSNSTGGNPPPETASISEASSSPLIDTRVNTTPVNSSDDSVIAKLRQTWEETISVNTLEDFSKSYSPLGYAPILKTGDLPVILRQGDLSEFAVLNVMTDELTVITESGPKDSYMYSGGDERYIIAYKYDKTLNTFPTPTEYVIYDTQSEAVKSIDLSAQADFIQGTRLYPYVGIYDGNLYFEAKDREAVKNEAGETTDYGFSIYQYNIDTEDTEVWLDHGQMPTMTADGLYFMNIGSNQATGSLYHKATPDGPEVELIKNCQEYQIADGKILFTRSSGAGNETNSVFLWENGQDRLLYANGALTKGWDFRYNGRLVSSSNDEAMLSVYDSLLGKKVQLTEARTLNFCAASEKYLSWYEVTNPDRDVSQRPNLRLCYIDISDLMK